MSNAFKQQGFSAWLGNWLCLFATCTEVGRWKGHPLSEGVGVTRNLDYMKNYFDRLWITSRLWFDFKIAPLFPFSFNSVQLQVCCSTMISGNTAGANSITSLTTVRVYEHREQHFTSLLIVKQSVWTAVRCVETLLKIRTPGRKICLIAADMRINLQQKVKFYTNY